MNIQFLTGILINHSHVYMVSEEFLNIEKLQGWPMAAILKLFKIVASINLQRQKGWQR